MAEETKPVESEAPAKDPMLEQVRAILPDPYAEDEPEETPESPVPEPTPAPAQPAPASPPPERDPTLILKALQLGVQPEEIDDSSPKELARLVANLERVKPQSLSQQAIEPKETPAAVAEDDTFVDPETGAPIDTSYMDPSILAAFKAQAKKIKKQQQALEERENRDKTLREQEAARHSEQITKSVQADLNEMKFGAQFDTGSAKGAKAFKDLMGAMGMVFESSMQRGERLDQKEIIRRGMAMIGVNTQPELSPAQKALAARAEEWNQAAISKPTQRRADGAVDAVRKILQRHRAEIYGDETDAEPEDEDSEATNNAMATS